MSIAALVAIFTLFLVLFVRKRFSRLPLPPGPPGYPLLGNVAEKSDIFDWRKFPEHRARWGDITSVTVLGKTIVTLHSYEKAVGLLDKKGLIHSSRPNFEMLNLCGWTEHVAHLPYGAQLQQCRRMIRTEINHDNVGQFHAYQEASVLRMLRLLSKNPDDFYDLIEWHLASILLKIVYGYDSVEGKDPMISLVHQGLSYIEEATTAGQAIEALPWLRHIPSWFPFAGFKRSALKWRQDYNNMRDVPFAHAEGKSKAGDPNNNFVAKWLSRMQSPQEVSNLKHSATIFYSAGVETTSIVLQTFFFRMQEHPAIQRQAQKELDDIVGRGILPKFSDKDKLPFIDALCKELLRHTPTLPGGMPHKSTADDIHDGYFIPKGTITIASIREMARDPSVYTDPETFDPARFLGSQPERDPRLYAFGFGRRICSGMLLAQESLYLTVTAVLSTMDISPFDPKMPAKFEHTEGLVSHPQRFQCRIMPRVGVDLDDVL